MRQQLCTIVSSLFVAAVFNGCGGGLDDAPETGDVSGTVTMDGKPLPNADIAFQAERSRPAIGKTDANGKYTLQYSKDLSGAKIGPNVVSITSGSAEGGEYSEEGEQKETIPAKYNSESGKNPDMKVEVKAGSNEFNFDLKSTE